MPRELKVYSWQGFRSLGIGSTREWVAAYSKAEVYRITGNAASWHFNMGETGNEEQRAIALAEPGVVFWQRLTKHSDPIHRDS